MNLFLRGCFIISLLLQASCMLKDNADLIAPYAEQKIYIEAYLTPGQPLTSSIFESNSLDQSLSVKLIWNAEAEILLQDTVIQLLNLFYYESETGKLINYVNPHLIKVQQDSLFLVVNLPNGKQLHSATEVLASIEILDYEVKNGMLSITCNQVKNSEHRFYGLFLQIFNDGGVSTQTAYFNYSTSTDDQVILQSYLEPDADSIMATVYRINALNYDFQTKLKQANSANIDPYQSPVQLPSNIKGGAGIFTFYTSDSILIKF